jgi:hypothetical protein
MAVGIHVVLLYPQKLALTSPTSGGRSVGIVRSRTQATVFVVCLPKKVRCNIGTFFHKKFSVGEFWHFYNPMPPFSIADCDMKLKE